MKWSILAAVAMTSTTPAAAVTIVTANRMLDVASGRYVDKGKMIGLKQRQTFQRAVRAGVKMIFGTDAGVYPHGQNARQFAKMVQWA